MPERPATSAAAARNVLSIIAGLLSMFVLAAGFHDIDLAAGLGLRRRHRCRRACRRWRRTLPFPSHRAWRVLVPAGILVIARRQALAHLHDREHAAHLDRPELAEAGHHGQRV